MELNERPALEFRQGQIRRQIAASLDLLQGHLTTSPSQRGYYQLRRKVEGRSVGRYVRQRLLPQVRAMIQNRARVEHLLEELSEVNWRLLQLPPEV
jgi:hypothetical protein